MTRILAVDIGTSRIKCAVFEENGGMTHLLSRRLNRAASPELQDAEEWFAVTASLLRELTARAGFAADAVVLTGNMHALLGISRGGDPVAPARLWSDNSAGNESDLLNSRYGKHLLERFGNTSIPLFPLPKMMRMKLLHPELYSKSVSFLQSKDFIAYRLTGRFATDVSDASGTLAMDLASGTWAADLLEELGLDAENLPEILSSTAVCGQVTASAARLTGLLEGTPVIIGSGDLASAALGGGVNSSTVSLTLGTAGQLLACGDPGCGKALAGRLFIFAHADPTKELYLGSVPSGGFSFEWLASLHQISVDDLFRNAAQTALRKDSPLFFPYLLGKGAPSMEYSPCGAWLNLSAKHGLGDLCRAAVFGTLCPLRQCADLLESLAGARPNLMLQALACREDAVRESAGELFPQRKFLPENSEASLLGAAMIGMTSLGIYADMDAAGSGMIRKEEACLEHTPLAEELYRYFLDYGKRIHSFSVK